MPRSNQPIRTFLGALVLSAGFATPLALADESANEQPQLGETESRQQDAAGNDKQPTATKRDSADFVEVRVSLPDGRTFTRLEPKRNISARYTRKGSAPASTSRRMSDGSRISVASHSVRGGSNASSVRIGGSSGGGGGASSSSGGGGGGGGAAASSATKGSSGSAGVQAPVEAKASGGGIFSFGSEGSNSGSANAPSSNASGSSAGRQSVPTIGEPSYDREGNATGGQRVEFHDAGMSAAVIGNRVYFNNVELVVADQPFQVISGTRLEHNSAIMEDGRLGSGGTGALGSFNTRSSSIKLEFESDTTVTLMLYTQSQNSFNPERDMRTWTVRIR